MFKKIFVRLCNERGEPPTVVCRKLGLSGAAFSEWNENSVPRRATLERVADYFGVSVEYLLGKQSRQTKIRVPVYGKVAAGIPIEAISDIEDFEELNADEYSVGEYFALKIGGDSMEPRFRRGDTVIVRRQEDVNSGEIAIVLVNGTEATCKKIQKTPGGVMLLSTNPVYEPMFYTNEEVEMLPVQILGKVVELRAKF